MDCNSDVIVSKDDKSTDWKIPVKQEIEKLMSMDFMANNPSFVSKLDSDGYISISYLLSLPSISKYTISQDDLVDIIKTVPTVSLAPNNMGVRLSLPMARKTIILRDVPPDTIESTIRSLFSEDAIETIKEEINHSWFVTLKTEEDALLSLEELKTKAIAGTPLKARIKSEYYMKVFMQHLHSALKSAPSEAKPRRMSVDATPFVLSDGKLDEMRRTFQLRAALQQPSEMDDFSFGGDVNRYRGFNIDLFPSFSESASSIPFVATSSPHVGYTEKFIRYTPEEILEIVHNMKDKSLPPIATPGDHSIAVIEKTPNVELVEKGRTMSIDHASFLGHPRTLSVDSIDYTSMLTGEIEEEVVSYVRKQRRHRNKRRPA